MFDERYRKCMKSRLRICNGQIKRRVCGIYTSIIRIKMNITILSSKDNIFHVKENKTGPGIDACRTPSLTLRALDLEPFEILPELYQRDSHKII